MRTQAEVAAAIKAKTAEIDKLLSAGEARETKACTTDELTLIHSLNDEIKTLETEFEQIKSFDDVKAANDARKTRFKVSSNPMQHHAGEEDKPRSVKSIVEFALTDRLKHFTGDTKAEAAEKAYRFGKWLHANVFTQHPGSVESRQFRPPQRWQNHVTDRSPSQPLFRASSTPRPVFQSMGGMGESVVTKLTGHA
jgi:hypothetical protein